jgi:hypothetical protein
MLGGRAPWEPSDPAYQSRDEYLAIGRHRVEATP